MKTLLRIDASLRTEGSHSRILADFFETQWKTANPQGKVIHRDLTQQHLPHLTNSTVEAFYIPDEHQTGSQKEALKLSNELITELKSVDELVISSPLYNLNVPSMLKAYFDQVTRSGHSFKIKEDGSYQGLIDIKSVYLITTKGETYKGTPMESLDFQEPYLKTICGFLGMSIAKVFPLEGTVHPELLEKNKQRLQTEIQETFKQN